MANYAFRVSSSYESLAKTVESIAKHSDFLVIYEHPDASRKHIHGYVENLTVGTDTLKNWIKKELNVNSYPKSDWEFATKIGKGPKKGEPVDRDSIIYFHKGKYPLLYNKGFTKEFIEEQHAKSYTPSNEYVQKVQYKIVSESKEKSMKRQWDLIKEMRQRYKRVEAEGNVMTDDKLIDIVNGVLDENSIVCGVYKRMDYFDSLTVNLGRTRVADEMRMILERRRKT